MKDYRFSTLATMKPNDSEKWYISADIVGDIVIPADDLKSALEKYRATVTKGNYIDISNNAIKKAAPMYIDTPDGKKQIGLVITGKTAFETDGGRWIEKYIDLWVEISVLENAFENIA